MKKNFKKGFTLVELLVSLGIISLIVFALSNFQRDTFTLNFTLQSSLNAQLDARRVVKVMVAELRKVVPSAVGSYPIESPSTTSVTFYSDVDSNGVIDRVRYYLTGTTIRKGVITPSGSPLTYNPANEVVTNLINNVVSSSTLPVFQYYSSSYDGTTAPLATPVDIPSIRLVKISVIIDNDPNKSPTQIVVTSSVSLRNLKDNL